MNKTKKMTTLALLCTISYVAVFIGQFMPPLIEFLKYDPKDVVIVIGGFIYGPLSAFAISLVVSIIEMMSISGTHFIGCFMNIASTCAFACTASVIYTKYRSMRGGFIGLAAGSVCCIAVMMILNYFLTPIYMGVPRKAVVELLVPAILPFNIIKCLLNSALVLLLYKPMTRALKRAGLLVKQKSYTSYHSNIAVILTAGFMLVTCAVALWILNS